MLVLHAPIQLALSERLAADDDLVAAVLIGGAAWRISVALGVHHAARQVALGHDTTAAAVQPGMHTCCKQCKEERKGSAHGVSLMLRWAA